MERCKDNEHAWIVISWVSGRYDQAGYFNETQQHDLYALRARDMMCQHCLMRAEASDLMCIDPLRIASERRLAELPMQESQLEM